MHVVHEFYNMTTIPTTFTAIHRKHIVAHKSTYMADMMSNWFHFIGSFTIKSMAEKDYITPFLPRLKRRIQCVCQSVETYLSQQSINCFWCLLAVAFIFHLR
jgi:hypothetical protein